LILNQAGLKVEVQKAAFNSTAAPVARPAAGQIAPPPPPPTPVFTDAAGRAIATPKAIIPQALVGKAVVQKFMIDRTPIFLDGAGNVIQTEAGQAGGNEVLMAQNNSLVYYTTMVNDVFAYYLTGAKNNDASITNKTQFPTTQAELTGIINYATAHNKTLVDPQALAVEIKTSWVETTGLSNPADYITISATVPTYNTSNPLVWIPTGQKTTTLALVGMHVVGSVKGHPEMIWSTFEHVSNTPNVGYAYTNNANTPTNRATDIATGNWLFCGNNATGSFNVPRMTFSPDSKTIEAIPSQTVGPSNTRRENPWGKAPTATSSNTEVIAVNNSVLNLLSSADVRKNYILTGATWTIGGASPNGGNEVGTNLLTNSTMETYQIGTNCFSCHGSNQVGVSRIYNATKKMF
jgi:hypothetical protein